MKLHLSNFSGLNSFTGYGRDFVLLNGQRQERSVIVLPESVQEWTPTALDEPNLRMLTTLAVEILLLGTGNALRFPPAPVLATFRQQRIGLEIMDTSAACRTYNILLAEGRKVGAALIIGQDTI